MNKPRRKEIETIERDLVNLKTSARLIKERIDSVKDDEDEGFENLSENLQNSERGEAMQTASSNLDAAMQELDDVTSSCDEAIRNLEGARE
jgi:hypothetical protein